jgi:hypothetical protein
MMRKEEEKKKEELTSLDPEREALLDCSAWLEQQGVVPQLEALLLHEEKEHRIAIRGRRAREQETGSIAGVERPRRQHMVHSLALQASEQPHALCLRQRVQKDLKLVGERDGCRWPIPRRR